MDSLISTFHIDWHLIVAQAINFVVVLLVLYFFALKPLKKLMDERGKTIEGGLENAEKQKALLAEQQIAYEKALADARAEAVAMKKEAKADLAKFRAEEMEKVQAEVKLVVANGEAQIETKKAQMSDEFRKESVVIITSAIKKILGDVASGKIDAKLVEESIKNIK